MIQQGNEIYIDSFLNALRPKERLKVWEWANKYRMLSSKDSAEPGPYRTDRTPYAKEIMDELSTTSLTKVVVVKKGTQLGLTTVGLNWVGYSIDHDPAIMMVVWPSLPDAKKNSKIRLDPLIESNPKLKEKIKTGNNRDAKNTALIKDYPGGALLISGANSASSLRSVPSKYNFLDEVDAFPDDVEGEGDPIKLVDKRSDTFSKRKSFRISSPKTKEKSKIHREFLASDQRWFYVPCPHCGEFQILGHEHHDKPLSVFDHLHYKTIKDINGLEIVTEVHLFCKKCGVEIEEYNKTKMLANGKWIKHNPDSKVGGFFISAMYSPLGWFSWKKLCQEYVDAKNSGKKEDMQVFINTALGEVYEDTGEKPDHEKLFERREQYDLGVVPKNAIFITAAVDVQLDRFEVEVHAWGRKRERWPIERHIIMGDPDKSETQKDLEEYICRSFPHAKGFEIALSKVVIDSGYKAQTVYNFCRKFNSKRVIPIKGRDDMPQAVSLPRAVDVKDNGKTIRRGVKLWFIGTNVLKSELYGDLQKIAPEDIIEEYPHGFIHMPNYEQEYFSQLVAEERRIAKNSKGYNVVQWHKIRERNETLDLFIYNRAAAVMVGIDNFTEKHWQKLESEMTTVKKIIPKSEKKLKPKTARKPSKNTGYW